MKVCFIDFLLVLGFALTPLVVIGDEAIRPASPQAQPALVVKAPAPVPPSVKEGGAQASARAISTPEFGGLPPSDFIRLQGYLAEEAGRSPEMRALREQVLDLYRRQNEVLLGLAVKAHPQDADKLASLVAEMNRRMIRASAK